MSIETRQPDIPAHRLSLERPRREINRSIGQVAWIKDAWEDAYRSGDFDKANELLLMLETASQ